MIGTVFVVGVISPVWRWSGWWILLAVPLALVLALLARRTVALARGLVHPPRNPWTLIGLSVAGLLLVWSALSSMFVP
jgi:hypothetical protein